MAGNNTTHFFGFDKAAACLNTDNFAALTPQARNLTFLDDIHAQIISSSCVAPRDRIMTGGAAAAEVEAYVASGLLAYAEGGEALREGGGAPAEGSDNDDERSGGDLWVVAASPRIRAAFASLTTDAACVAYRSKAASELAKHEQAQRIEQLALADSVANANGRGHAKRHGGHKQHSVDVHRDVVGSDDLGSKPAE